MAASNNSTSPGQRGSGAGNFHILVVRLSAMGDVAMTVPVLSALTQQYPHVRITVLTKPFFAPMFAPLEHVTVFKAEVKGRHKGVFGLWTLYKELRALQIDAVADLHNVLRSKVLKCYFRFGGIPVVPIDKGRAEKKALTSLKHKIFKPIMTTHERYAEVFSKMDFPVDLSTAIPLPKVRHVAKILKLMGTDAKKRLGIAPFAAFEGKMYPMYLMEEVIQKLEDTKKYKIFLLGGGGDEERKLNTLEARFKSCTNVSGKLSFSEELALISKLDAMLSMDSGNGHLAAMYGIPVITLWGVTHPYAGFYPFGQDSGNALLADRKKFPLIPTSVYGNKMPKGYERAMETILPGDVMRTVQAVLGEP